MPTPVRWPLPKTLLTSVNTNSESLKTSSPFPQSCFHAHHSTSATSLTGSPQPYFGAVSLRTSSTLPRTGSTCEEGAPHPQKALGPTAQTRGGRPCPCPGLAPPGLAAAPPQSPPRKRLPQDAARRAFPRSGSPVEPPRSAAAPLPPRLSRPPHSRLSPSDEAVHGSRHLSGQAGK